MSYNQHIRIFEVKKVIDAAKRGKASGIDNVPVEVLKNDTAVSFLHVLFNICFDNGIVPADWGKCIIKPIPKSSTPDRRDPHSYRGISLASAIYKLYCSVLNMPDAVARAEACPLGMQAALSFIPTSGTNFRGDLVMKKMFTAILPLPLIQEEQLSITGERMCTKYW